MQVSESAYVIADALSHLHIELRMGSRRMALKSALYAHTAITTTLRKTQ